MLTLISLTRFYYTPPQISLDAPPVHVDTANHIPAAKIDPNSPTEALPPATPPPSHILTQDTPHKATPLEEGPVHRHIESRGKGTSLVCVCVVLLVCYRSIFQRLVLAVKAL